MFNSDDFKKSINRDIKKIVENKTLELSCDCGHKVKERVGRLQNDPKITCPACGVTLLVDGKELKAFLKKYE